eukprot:COSAG06_NODE_3106_length_5852_cov_6.243177_8_plen_40_part_00
MPQGALREFSTRERPWGLLHDGEWLALVNGVSEVRKRIF